MVRRSYFVLQAFKRSLPISEAQFVTAVLMAAHASAREQGHER